MNQLFVCGSLMSRAMRRSILPTVGGRLLHKFVTVRGVALTVHAGQPLTVPAVGLFGSSMRSACGEVWAVPDDVMTRLGVAEHAAGRQSRIYGFTYHLSLGAALYGRPEYSAYENTCRLFMPYEETLIYPPHVGVDNSLDAVRHTPIRQTDVWVEPDEVGTVVSVFSTPDSVVPEDSDLERALLGVPPNGDSPEEDYDDDDVPEPEEDDE